MSLDSQNPVPSMVVRFRAIEVEKGLWTVEDTWHKKFKMPRNAISLYVPELVAKKVALALEGGWLQSQSQRKEQT